LEQNLVEHLDPRWFGVAVAKANIMKPVARSELVLLRMATVVVFHPCAVPVLVAITLVNRPGSASSKGGE